MKKILLLNFFSFILISLFSQNPLENKGIIPVIEKYSFEVISIPNIDSLPKGIKAPFYTIPYFTNFNSVVDWGENGTTTIWNVGDQVNDLYGPPSGHSQDRVVGTQVNANYGGSNNYAYLISPEFL